METSVSPHVRLVAIVGLVAALGLGGGMMLLTRSQAEAEAAEPAPVVPAKKQAAAPAPAKPGAAKPAAAAKPAPPQSKPAAKPKPKPKPEPAVAANGFPMPVVRALQRSPVAVVALHNAGARTDLLTVAEAEAGALAAGAAFVRLDGLKETEGGALARLLGGVVDPPVVLVYQRPTALFLRFDGYVDKETVAQAALDAGAPGRDVESALVDPWVRAANAACADADATMPRLPTNATDAQVRTLAPQVLAAEQRLVQTLGAIPLPGDVGRRPVAADFVGSVKAWAAAEAKLFAAYRAGNAEAGLAAFTASQEAARRANASARQLGLAACERLGA